MDNTGPVWWHPALVCTICKCPVVAFGKKSGCTSMETAMTCGSGSSSPHSADMAIRKGDHQDVT